MNDLVLGGEYVKSGGKFHHRRKLCQVLTPPPTARKLNFPPWQFLSCSPQPPHSYLGQLSLRAKKSPRLDLGQVLSLGLVRCQQMCKNYKTFLDRLRGQNDQNIMLKPKEFIYKGPNEKVDNKNKF